MRLYLTQTILLTVSSLESTSEFSNPSGNHTLMQLEILELESSLVLHVDVHSQGTPWPNDVLLLTKLRSKPVTLESCRFPTVGLIFADTF